MGGAGSVPIENLSSYQTSEIARLMKEQYDKCQQYNQQQQYEKLMLSYYEIVETVVNTPHYMLPTSTRTKTYGRTSSNVKENGVSPQKKTSARRRSFDNNKTKLLKSSQSSNEIQESQSTPVLPVVEPQEPQGDSWDSVTSQPSCMICGMVFSSHNKLNTHTKYSALHKSNLLRIDRLQQEEEQRKIDESLRAAEADLLASPQEASERCRIFYSGSKFFWKEQFSLDLYIYLHIQPKIIEVIAFDDKATREYPRLYFYEEKLLERIGKETIDRAVTDYITEASNERFKEAIPPKSIIYEEMKRRHISSHLLTNLHFQDTVVYRLPEKSESALPSARDIPASDILCDSQPKDVIPVFITRRRHSTSEEFKCTVNDINVLQEDIRDLTRQAEILGSLITIGAMLFMKEGGARRQRLEAGKYSLPKRRWKSAIHDVLKQLRVAKTKKYLEKLRFQW